MGVGLIRCQLGLFVGLLIVGHPFAGRSTTGARSSPPAPPANVLPGLEGVHLVAFPLLTVPPGGRTADAVQMDKRNLAEFR